LTSSADFVEPSASGSLQAQASREPLPDWTNVPRAEHLSRESGGVDLTELKQGQCRYPLGELQPRRLLYCGKPALPGRSWRPAHRRLCVSN
jgi:hypothetical protein